MTTLHTIILSIITGGLGSIGTWSMIKYKKRKIDAETSKIQAETERIEAETEGKEINNLANLQTLYGELLLKMVDMTREVGELKQRISELESDYREAQNEIFLVNSILSEAVSCEHYPNCPILKKKKLIKKK